MRQVLVKNNENYYPVDCCFCGKEFHAAASIFQLGFGMLDFGTGSCPHCGNEQQLTLVPEENRMIAKKRWERNDD